MAAKLLPAGYDVVTINHSWYEPNASRPDFSPAPQPTLDEHGRLVPAPNGLPSSGGGRGLAPLAQTVHGLG